MNQETFERIYPQGLTPTQNRVLSLFLESNSDEEILAKIEANDRTTVIKHIKNICKIFEAEADSDYREKIIELFIKYKPELVSRKVREKYGYPIAPRFPDGYEPLDSTYYIARTAIEDRCYAMLSEAGALIRIKAPKQMGKTSLLKRIMKQAENKNYHTVYLDFSLIETQKLNNPYNLLRICYAYIQEPFPSAPALQEWNKDTPIMLQCTRQLQNLLQKIDRALVLVLDEVDKLFEYPETYQNFFPMLRNWHEKAKESETWEKLRVVVAHSTEDYGKLDINQSPFNVGLPIQLNEFTLEQVKNLASRHGLNREDAIELMSMIEGHPYLVQLAFYHLSSGSVTLQQLLRDAPSNAGIYQEHLRRYLVILQNNQELRTVFQQIFNNEQLGCLRERTIQLYQLESMGLIKLEGNSVKVRCNLYQLYFRDRLAQ